MDYTEAMLRCMRKLSEWRLEELEMRLEREFASSEILEYLKRLIKVTKVKRK